MVAEKNVICESDLDLVLGFDFVAIIDDDS